ncbi:hypothetical protein A2662_03840 [Candidatus Giovannonibacteria bacterium RIFCSPHIGHO2_01_FULL_45_33]|nr:MAG: hypothetical protein A2662_03840 [Candidatus Giovannonibacteria bacterium RIFCSPHIGHO2_01_FULL_45_33]
MASDGRVFLFALKILTSYHLNQNEWKGRNMSNKKIYAFDVDDTLEISKGPVPVGELRRLRLEGHVVGLCGNWAVFTNAVPGWENLVSFLGPVGTSKEEFLRQIKKYCKANEYILVGNDPAVFGGSNDRGAASAAGWRFIQEQNFANGER